jgi:hypothetical protein
LLHYAFHFAACPENDRLSGAYGGRFQGPRVSADPLAIISDLKYAKIGKFDILTTLQCLDNVFQHTVDNLAAFSSR